MSSFALDRVRELSKQLDSHTPTLLEQTTLTTASDDSSADTSSRRNRLVQLRQALKSIRLDHDRDIQSPEPLLKVLEDVFGDQERSSPHTLETESQDGEQALELVLLAKVSLASYAVVMNTLMQRAGRMGDEIEYWKRIEDAGVATLTYFIQTLPLRSLNVLRALQSRLRAFASSPNPPQQLLSLTVIRKALPPSLLVSSLFPHLSAQRDGLLESSRDGAQVATATGSQPPKRSLIFLTFSPIFLTRQEARFKRQSLERERKSLARAVGLLASAGLGISQEIRVSSARSLVPAIKEAIEGTAHVLEQALSVSQTEADGVRSPKSSGSGPSFTSDDPTDFPKRFQYLLAETLPSRESEALSTLKANSRPSLLVRSWPVLVGGPFLTIIISRIVYNSRQTIKGWFVDARETVRGFLVGWVYEPCMKIIETVRHGEEGTLRVMGKESLKSDLSSLERMVADFGKDTYGLSEQEAQEIAKRVREGDLTPVLRAWENDIKTPLRSTVRGSLVRALLIQIQKVKVDVALAMDGIEKMLQSQQLTFAAVGVAPSLIILFITGSWAQGFVTGSNERSRNTKMNRRRVWSAVRRIDRLLVLSPKESRLDTHSIVSYDSQSPSTVAESHETLGLLLLELHFLRVYATTSLFPLRDRSLRDEFMDDVRDLEDSELDFGTKRRVLDRMWRSWSGPLKWSEIR